MNENGCSSTDSNHNGNATLTNSSSSGSLGGSNVKISNWLSGTTGGSSSPWSQRSSGATSPHTSHFYSSADFKNGTYSSAPPSPSRSNNPLTLPHSSPLATTTSSLVNAMYAPTMSSFNILPNNEVFEREGWLTKQGKVVKNWKRRWFVLRDNALCYYKSKEHVTKGGPAGRIDLSEAVLVQEVGAQSSKYGKITKARKGQGNTFEIRTADRTFIMYADSPQEMEEWLVDINKSVSGLGTSPQPFEETTTVLLNGELDCERCCDRILKLLLNFTPSTSLQNSLQPSLFTTGSMISIPTLTQSSQNASTSSSPTFSFPIPTAVAQVISVHIDPKEELVVVTGKNLDPGQLIARLSEAGFTMSHLANKYFEEKTG